MHDLQDGDETITQAVYGVDGQLWVSISKSALDSRFGPGPVGVGPDASHQAAVLTFNANHEVIAAAADKKRQPGEAHGRENPLRLERDDL